MKRTNIIPIVLDPEWYYRSRENPVLYDEFGISRHLMHQVRHAISNDGWTRACMLRDQGICTNCYGFGYQVEVHHIKPLRIIVIENQIESIKDALNCKELFDRRNGISLCRTCHRKAELSVLNYPSSFETIRVWVNRETREIKHAVLVCDLMQELMQDVFVQMTS